VRRLDAGRLRVQPEIALLFMVVPAHLIWLLERRRKDGIITNDRDILSIFNAQHWVATTLLSQHEGVPYRLRSRIVGFVWMFDGVAFVAFFTTQLTAWLTIEKIRADINGPDDLLGKQVATLRASTSSESLQEHGVQR
jgi:polar amino acid transport system substrate-binding protein